MGHYHSSGMHINGNYVVEYSGLNLKKRCFRFNEKLVNEFPDSIDLKITNKCSNGCYFCHENSTINGKVAELSDIKYLVDTQLPKAGIEIAIGGGNLLETDTLSEILEIINYIDSAGYRVRITISEKDVLKLRKLEDSGDPESRSTLKKNMDILKLAGGIGISLVNEAIDGDDSVFTTKLPYGLYYNNIVYHLIAGIYKPENLKKILKAKEVDSILILGYKQFGRAAGTELPESISEFEKIIKNYFLDLRKSSGGDKKAIAFDNLALEQLHLRDSLTEQEWDELYLGDEGTCSMYIDAVERTYAVNSRSSSRVSWNDRSMLDFFNSLKK